jgi:hypothetical protein
MQLAQLNIALLEAPIEAPRFDGFRAALDRINALAEASPGFIWRLVGDGGDATDLRPFGPEWLVNLSVWQDVEALFNFTYKTAHTEVMAQRKSWFPKMASHHMVLWWVPDGHVPTTREAGDRLRRLNEHGPTPDAFTFKVHFDARGNPIR